MFLKKPSGTRQGEKESFSFKGFLPSGEGKEEGGSKTSWVGRVLREVVLHHI